MEDVANLLKAWELPELIPIFTEQRITVEALSALSNEDLKDLIPLTGPRVLFNRCWRSWKNEFSPNTSAANLSLPDLSNYDIELGLKNDGPKDLEPEVSEPCIIVLNQEEDLIPQQIQQEPNQETETQNKILESLLKQSLETSSLLIYKGGTLDGDATRNSFTNIKLNIDFEEIYKEHTNHLFIYFPVAKIKILELLKIRKSKDIFGQELICLAESSKEEHQNLAAFLTIPYLLNTTPVKIKKKKEEPGCSWKPSKAEARDAFIKHVRTDADIESAIQLRLRLLKNKRISSQPYVMIVGESLQYVKTFLVIVNASAIYQTSNILQAVDICYKAIWSLNVEYGTDSYAIWYFIQKGIYKMTSEFDRGSTTAESLLTDCNL